MFRFYNCGFLCVILTSLVTQSYTIGSGGSINFDLSTYQPSNKSTHVFKRYETLINSAQLNIEFIPRDVGFLLVQVHSYEDNVLLSNTSVPLLHSKVNGTNIGFVELVDDRKSFNYYLYGREEKNISILVVVIAYTLQDPIPGGCNLTFNVEIAPYQKLSYDDYLIKVSAQAASISGGLCEDTLVNIDMYHMFLSEWDLSPQAYFKGIEKMLTVDDIVTNGRKAPEPIGKSNLQRYYCAYRGTGSVFAVIARFENGSSAYIPAVSYACDIEKGAESCYGPVTTYWRVMCGLMVFFGLFICFCGHRFFQVTLFFTGFVVAALLTYMAIFYINITFGESLLTLGIVGLLYGTLWVAIWWKFGIPLLSVLLPFAVTGYLIASIIFYIGLDDIQLFQNSISYWCILIGILLLITLVLLILSTLHSNILVTSFLGSYIFIIPIDHYVGGNLRYIFLNTLHRAVVENFNLAVTDPPYQVNDQSLSILWIACTVAGVLVQWRHNKGRAPFPPPPTRTRVRRRYNERTPLLS